MLVRYFTVIFSFNSNPEIFRQGIFTKLRNELRHYGYAPWCALYTHVYNMKCNPQKFNRSNIMK